jgi:hypothetical protein
MAEKRKRRGPYDPYPGWGPQLSEKEFYRAIGDGPRAFTRPGSHPHQPDKEKESDNGHQRIHPKPSR